MPTANDLAATWFKRVVGVPNTATEDEAAILLLTGSNPDINIADSGEREYTHVVATVTNTGDTTVYTPASGKKIRLHWLYCIGDPATDPAPLINIKLGATPIYRVYALSKRQLKTGPIDGSLIFNLSSSGSVAVTAILEEV